MKEKLFILIIIALIIGACKNKNDKSEQDLPKGKLFIIGGGKLSDNLIKDLSHISGVDISGYAVILPMASEEPDSAAFYAIKMFNKIGVKNIVSFNFEKPKDYTKSKIDSLLNAKLIYISGGDQNKFMKQVVNTEVYKTIHNAFFNGTVISGTSAGAAIMSKKMITGNEKKNKIYTGNYKTIQANNIEISTGLGFVDKLIVDQHFIKRMRMNRLISVCLENPDYQCVGIDESTAILVANDIISVFGENQVIAIKHNGTETKIVNGLLGGTNITLDVYLPGDSFKIKSN